MKKCFVLGGLMASLLSGCGMAYLLEGARYESKESFVAARSAMNARCMENVVPFPVPLVKRKLIAFIPSQEAIYKNRFKIVKAAIPNDPITIEGMRDNPLFSGLNENYRIGVEMLRRKNIFPSVEIVEYENLSLPQASADVDIFYIEMPEILGGKDTFYLTTQKGGRQLVNISAAVPRCEALRDSFHASVQTIALQ
jgi:hypothetical protein